MTADQPQAKNSRRGLRRPAGVRWLDENLNSVVVTLIALVTVFAGLVAYLETGADNAYSVAVREGQTLAMDALGNEMSSRQRENYDFALYTTWSEWEERYSQTQGADETAAARARHVMDLIAPQSPLLDETGPYFTPETLTRTYGADVGAYHVDMNLVETTRLLEKRAFAIERASVWNAKADGYVTVLTVLAVALFLFGLSTTMKGGLRYVFVVAGSILVGLAVTGTVDLALRPILTIPDEAIAAYAEGKGRTWTLDYEGAVESFDRAVAAYPAYTNALAERGKAHLRADDYEAAVADFMLAIEQGRESASTYWELGWAHYLLGNYEASLAASRRGLELDPDLLPVLLNIATAQLASGDAEGAMFEYELALTLAADPNAAVPISWNHLYLRETVNDLDRLLAAVGGQTDFADAPDLSRVTDRAALRTAAEAARQRLKEGLVSLEVAGQPRMEPAGRDAVAVDLCPLRGPDRGAGRPGRHLCPGRAGRRGQPLVRKPAPGGTRLAAGDPPVERRAGHARNPADDGRGPHLGRRAVGHLAARTHRPLARRPGAARRTLHCRVLRQWPVETERQLSGAGQR